MKIYMAMAKAGRRVELFMIAICIVFILPNTAYLLGLQLKKNKFLSTCHHRTELSLSSAVCTYVPCHFMLRDVRRDLNTL